MAVVHLVAAVAAEAVLSVAEAIVVAEAAPSEVIVNI